MYVLITIYSMYLLRDLREPHLMNNKWCEKYELPSKFIYTLQYAFYSTAQAYKHLSSHKSL